MHLIELNKQNSLSNQMWQFFSNALCMPSSKDYGPQHEAAMVVRAVILGSEEPDVLRFYKDTISACPDLNDITKNVFINLFPKALDAYNEEPSCHRRFDANY